MVSQVKRLFVEERGQGMAEYGLILVFVALVAVVGLTAMGGQLSSLFDTIKTKLTP
ncbi:MAG: Flp family type IVb pilin [Firmicutes bacterium]|nr:Flp family type IVb pilin [Bacillota bacterium]